MNNFSILVCDSEGSHRSLNGQVLRHNDQTIWQVQGSDKRLGMAGTIVVGDATADNIIGVVPRHLTADELTTLDEAFGTEDYRKAFAVTTGLTVDQRIGKWETTNSGQERRRAGAHTEVGELLARPSITIAEARGVKVNRFGLMLSTPKAGAQVQVIDI